MALTNAERQARHRQRLKNAAGVSPEMVVQAARILFDNFANSDPDAGTWEQLVARSKTRRYRDLWPQFVPDGVHPDAFDHLEGEDRALVEKVAAVIHAARYPPDS